MACQWVSGVCVCVDQWWQGSSIDVMQSRQLSLMLFCFFVSNKRTISQLLYFVFNHHEVGHLLCRRSGLARPRISGKFHLNWQHYTSVLICSLFVVQSLAGRFTSLDNHGNQIISKSRQRFANLWGELIITQRNDDKQTIRINECLAQFGHEQRMTFNLPIMMPMHSWQWRNGCDINRMGSGYWKNRIVAEYSHGWFTSTRPHRSGTTFNQQNKLQWVRSLGSGVRSQAEMVNCDELGGESMVLVDQKVRHPRHCDDERIASWGTTLFISDHHTETHQLLPMQPASSSSLTHSRTVYWRISYSGCISDNPVVRLGFPAKRWRLMRWPGSAESS